MKMNMISEKEYKSYAFIRHTIRHCNKIINNTMFVNEARLSVLKMDQWIGVTIF